MKRDVFMALFCFVFNRMWRRRDVSLMEVESTALTMTRRRTMDRNFHRPDPTTLSAGLDELGNVHVCWLQCSLFTSVVQHSSVHCSHQKSSIAVFNVHSRGLAKQCSLFTPEVKHCNGHVSFHLNVPYLVQENWRTGHSAQGALHVHLNKSCTSHAHLNKTCTSHAHLYKRGTSHAYLNKTGTSHVHLYKTWTSHAHLNKTSTSQAHLNKIYNLIYTRTKYMHLMHT